MTDRWLSPDTPVFSTNKTHRHDIIEILLQVVLNTINQAKLFLTLILMLVSNLTDRHVEGIPS